jgi:cadmium resistance protein CadD (predicted permease)
MSRLGFMGMRSGGPTASMNESGAGLMGLGLAAVALVPFLAASISDRQWGLTATWAVLIAATVSWIVWRLVQSPAEEPEPTQYFKPFAEPDPDWTWPRDAEVSALQTSLLLQRVTLVVGASGMGKTVLLGTLLPGALGRTIGDDYFRISTYEPTHHRLQQAAQRDDAIVVLDQFEQYLAYLETLSPNECAAEKAWLKSAYLEARTRAGVRFIIAVRQEWYFSLKFLADLLPSFEETVTVTPPADIPGDPIREKMIEQFVEGLGLAKTTAGSEILEMISRDRDGRLLPLEVQIVGAQLERSAKRHNVGPKYLERVLHGVSGAINEYFDDIIEGAPDRRVALKVLCALSARTRFRRQEAFHNILEAVYEVPEDVERALGYLREQSLIVQVDRAGTRFELTHDYLAELFNQKSATDLDPAERDNVQYHITEPDDDGATQGSLVLSLSERQGGTGRWTMPRVVLIVLAALMTIRLLDFGLPWYVANSGPIERTVAPGHLLDQTYLVVYAPQLAWAVYLALFYERIFANLRESRLEKLMSQMTVLVVLPCAIVAMFIPHAWILSIGCCGFVIGLKMMSVGRARQVNAAARKRMFNMGIITTSNMVLALLVGGTSFGFSIALVHTPADTNTWTLLMVPWSVLFTVACLTLAPSHVQRSAAALTLGFLARPVMPLVPRPES